MDEPLSSLDAKLRAELRLELKRIQVELGATILYVTHDQVEAMTMASRIGVIRDGELLQLGTPREIYEDPSDRYVASRLGTPQINFLAGDASFPKSPMPSGTETIGIRTEHLRIAKANGGGLVGRVHRIEHLGDQNHVHLEYRGQTLVTLADPHQPLKAGQEVELQLGASALLRCRRTARRGDDSLRIDPMTIEPETLKSLVKAAAEQVIASAPELTALDQAIGDGDHGANMKRGFEAVLGKLDAIGAQPLDEALKTIGKTLVMTVGGASGPLYGSFFMAAGEALSRAGNCPMTSLKSSAAAWAR